MKKKSRKWIWIVIVIITIIIIWSSIWIWYVYFSWAPPTGEQECLSIFAYHCAYCRKLNWTSKYEAYIEDIQECDDKWNYEVQGNLEDCNNIKQFCNEVVGVR